MTHDQPEALGEIVHSRKPRIGERVPPCEPSDSPYAWQYTGRLIDEEADMDWRECEAALQDDIIERDKLGFYDD